MIRQICCSIVLLCLILNLAAYVIPVPTFKVYRKGIEVSIPHEHGIQILSFAAKLDTKIQRAGSPANITAFSGTIYEPDANGHWTYSNNDAELNIGDILLYLVIVKKNESFSSLHSVYNVTNYAYRVPDPSFKIYRRGFQMSIPYEDGIEFFGFSANQNAKIKNYGIGTLSGTMQEPDENGELTSRNFNAELQIGDTLNYWVGVSKNGEDYYKTDLVYTVRNYEEPATSAIVHTTQYSLSNLSFNVHHKGFDA